MRRTKIIILRRSRAPESDQNVVLSSVELMAPRNMKTDLGNVESQMG